MPVQPDIPTSVALAQMLENAPKDRIELGWLIDHLGKRSFGLLLLILSVAGLAPGIATFIGLVIAIPAVEMMLGRERPALPRFLTSRSVPTEKFARVARRFIPLFRAMEALIRPRFHTSFPLLKRLVGAVVFALATTLFAPFPLNILPTLAIMLIAFAYLQEDGLLLFISLAAAAASLSLTSAAIVATAHATGFLHRLWLRA